MIGCNNNPPLSPSPPSPPLAPPEVKLCVRAVDLLSSQSGQNRTEHHTDAFHGDELVLRRGQAFQIQLELSRPYNQDTDSMHLDLKTGRIELI